MSLSLPAGSILSINYRILAWAGSAPTPTDTALAACPRSGFRLIIFRFVAVMCIPLSLSEAQTQKTRGKAIGHQGSKARAGEGIAPGADGQPLGTGSQSCASVGVGANPHTFQDSVPGSTSPLVPSTGPPLLSYQSTCPPQTVPAGRALTTQIVWIREAVSASQASSQVAEMIAGSSRVSYRPVKVQRLGVGTWRDDRCGLGLGVSAASNTEKDSKMERQEANN